MLKIDSDRPCLSSNSWVPTKCLQQFLSSKCLERFLLDTAPCCSVWRSFKQFPLIILQTLTCWAPLLPNYRPLSCNKTLLLTPQTVLCRCIRHVLGAKCFLNFWNLGGTESHKFPVKFAKLTFLNSIYSQVACNHWISVKNLKFSKVNQSNSKGSVNFLKRSFFSENFSVKILK